MTIKTYKTIGAAIRAAKDRYPIIRVNGGCPGCTEALYIVPVEGSADIDLLGTDGRYVATVVDIRSRAPFITTAPCSGARVTK